MEKNHPKAAFALFLNQAEHNLVKAIGKVSGNKDLQVKSDSNKTIDAVRNLKPEQIKELEQKYFRFLKGDKQEDKQHYLILLIEKLYELRNYYSHNYHADTSLFLEKENIDDLQVKTYLESKHEQIIDELKSNYELEDLEYLNYNYAKEELKKYLLKINKKFDADNFDKSAGKIYESNIEIKKQRGKEDEKKIKDEVLHEKAGAYIHYHLFEETQDKYKFEPKAVVLLASFFLDKRQANLLISKIRGFKRTQDKQAQATRNCFTHFHIKNPQSSFVSQNSDVAFYVDAITHLSKIPKIVLDNLENQPYKFTRGSYKTITDMIYSKHPEKRDKIRLAKGVLEDIQKLEELESLEIKGTENFLEKVKQTIGVKNLEAYKEIILNHSLSNEKVRTQKDRFTRFALQFIDDFNLLPNIKFKVYTGDYDIETEEKEYHNRKFPPKEIIKRKTDYASIQEYEFSLRQNVGCFYYETWDEFVDDFQENQNRLQSEKKFRKLFEQTIKYNPANYDYYIKDNNVFFKAAKHENCFYYGSISKNELRNFVFALIDKGSKEVENALFAVLEKNAILYKKITDGEDKEKIKAYVNDNFPNEKLPQYILKWLNEKGYTNENFKKDILIKLEYIKNDTEKFKVNVKNIPEC